jgi:hypothetical protein
MLFRIAEVLGRTVSELEYSLSFSEFVEWCNWLKVKSWQEQGLDLSGPFLPDHPDFEIWASMQKVGGQ